MAHNRPLPETDSEDDIVKIELTDKGQGVAAAFERRTMFLMSSEIITI